MSGAFTPGPWCVLSQDGDGTFEVRGPQDELIAEVLGLTADGHLMGASPELYDALEELLPCVGSPTPLPDTAERVRHAVAALAKARGGVLSPPISRVDEYPTQEGSEHQSLPLRGEP